MKYLFFDTETSGLPGDCPLNTPQPRLVSLAFILTDEDNNVIDKYYELVKVGFEIPQKAVSVHGITNEQTGKYGLRISSVLDRFTEAARQADVIVGHNISFDIGVIEGEYMRAERELPWKDQAERFCTMKHSASKFECRSAYGPNLTLLHNLLFGHGFDDAHNAMSDCEAMRSCFWELQNSYLRD